MQSSIRIAAVASLSALALVAATGVAADAAANPDNHGHHYGQLKHPKVTSPPPAPVPVPTPAPHPVVQPSPSIAPAVRTTPHVAGPTTPALQPVPSPALPLTIPASDPVVQVSPVAATADDYGWLLLLILPTLIAIWLIAFVGLARRLSGARQNALEVQTQPA